MTLDEEHQAIVNVMNAIGITFIITAFITMITFSYFLSGNWRAEAIRHKAAHYDITPQGEPEWHWNDEAGKDKK